MISRSQFLSTFFPPVPNSPFSLSGHCLHQPSERGLCVPPAARAGQRGGGVGAGASGHRPHLPLHELLLHGQRDLLPAEALPGGGQQGAVLGPLPLHHQHSERRHAEDQRGALLLHRDLHGAESVWADALRGHAPHALHAHHAHNALPDPTQYAHIAALEGKDAPVACHQRDDVSPLAASARGVKTLLPPVPVRPKMPPSTPAGGGGR